MPPTQSTPVRQALQAFNAHAETAGLTHAQARAARRNNEDVYALLVDMIADADADAVTPLPAPAD